MNHPSIPYNDLSLSTRNMKTTRLSSSCDSGFFTLPEGTAAERKTHQEAIKPKTGSHSAELTGTTEAKALDYNTFRNLCRMVAKQSWRPLDVKLKYTDYIKFECELENPKYIPGKIVDPLRYSYNLDTEVLNVSSMPTKVHNYITAFLVYLLLQMVASGFLSVVEASQVHTDFGSSFEMPTTSSNMPKGSQAKKRRKMTTKQPDAAFLCNQDGGESRFPTMVFEVGFTQSYASLVEDMRTWLCGTEGKVRRAFLIKIQEWTAATSRSPHDTENLTDTHSQSGIASQSEEDSEALSVGSRDRDTRTDWGAEDYEELEKNIDVDASVGPFSVWLEEYRYCAEKRDIKMHGPRIHLLTHNICDPNYKLPHLETDARPSNVILKNNQDQTQSKLLERLDASEYKLTDTPLVFTRRDFIDQPDTETPERTFEVPLQRYRDGIVKARRALATGRVLRRYQREASTSASEFAASEKDPGDESSRPGSPEDGYNTRGRQNKKAKASP